jgi:hypothetical protein
MTTALHEAGVDPTATDGQPDGQDVEKGKLFEGPRVGVIIDETDPTVLRLAFSGKIELERSNAGDVEIYNALKAGETRTLSLDVHVAGAKTTHRRDGEGDVDAVVQTKSLIVHSLNVD